MADKREDGSYKGSGFFGTIMRPDGRVSSELSMGTTDVNGQELEIPLMVPTLSREELTHLLSNDVSANTIPQSIAMKAVEFARGRLAGGKAPFAGPGEQQFNLYPEFKRAPRASDVPLASSGHDVDPEALRNLLIQRELGR